MGKLIDSIESGMMDYEGSSINLRTGGMNGIIPTLGVEAKDGSLADGWVASNPYISQDIIPIVLRTPGGYDLLPDAEKWKRTWRAIFTEHALSIQGLNNGINVEVDETEIGGTGQYQEETRDTKYNRSSLTTEHKEKEFKTISKFLINTVRLLDKDPISKKPLASNFISDLSEVNGGWTRDLKTGTILFVEPDPTRLIPVDVWYATNIGIKGNIDRIGKRQQSAGGESNTFTVEWTNIVLPSEKAWDLARKLLPIYLGSVDTLSSDIKLTESDIEEDLKD